MDYYNEMPSGVNVIEKMNEELSDLQKEYDELDKRHDKYVKTHKIITFDIPKIRLNSLDELKVYGKKIYDSTVIFHKIIYDFLGHEGWITEYDSPDGAGTNILGYAKCGFWDTYEMETLTWGDTTADKFYAQDITADASPCDRSNADAWRGHYNLYLKCKIVDELYKLFPEYTNREYGWFQKEIDQCFRDIENSLIIIISRTSGGPIMWQLHDIIYQLIMEQLFGWGEEIDNPGTGYSSIGIFPEIYDNSDYVQNIIYYQCDQCNKYTVGEDAMGNHDECDRKWYYHDNDDDEEVNQCRCDEEVNQCRCNE